MKEAYYYESLTRAHQAAYHAMKTGITALAGSFSVPKLEARELSEIFLKLRLDCPEIFYVSGFRYRTGRESSSVEFLPDYLFDKGKIREHQKAIQARIARLVRPAANMTVWEKEQYIHDFICSNVRYDKLKKPYSHEIIGPLVQGVGVCEGIAKTVKILCDELGIWCVTVLSEANPEKQIKYRHAWNVVSLDGVCYHVDATFDNTLGKCGTVRYDYLNLDDSRVFRDHEPVLYQAPVCPNGDRFYYKEKKLSFTREEDVEKRALQAIRKKIPLVFHWRGGYLTRETAKRLIRILGEAGAGKGRQARISLNWPQAVFYVEFAETDGSAPAETAPAEVRLEESNEGERANEVNDVAREGGMNERIIEFKE